MDYHLYPLVPFAILYFLMYIYPLVTASVMSIFILMMCSQKNLVKIFGVIGFIFTALMLDTSNYLWVSSISAGMCLFSIFIIRVFREKRIYFWQKREIIGLLLLTPLLYLLFINFAIPKNQQSNFSLVTIHIWAFVIVLHGLIQIFRHLYAQNTRYSWLASACIMFAILPMFYGIVVDAHYQKTSLHGHWNINMHPAGEGPKEPIIYDEKIPGIVPIGIVQAGKNQVFYIPPAHPFLKTYAVIRVPYDPDSQDQVRMYKRTPVYPFFGSIIVIRNSFCKNGMLHVIPSCWLPAGTHTLTSTHYLRQKRGVPYPPLTGHMVERIDTITVEPNPVAPK